MKHLWQRIFVYTLLMIIASQLAMFLWYRFSEDADGMRRFMAGQVSAIAGAMEGLDLATARAIALPYNRRENRVWLENPESGQVLAGKRNALQAAHRAKVHAGLEPLWTVENLRIWRYQDGGERHITAQPIKLRDGEAELVMAFGPPRRSSLWIYFVQGGLVLSSIGVLLALWMAWRVSRPLRKLRGEVLEIAGGDLNQRVSVSGRDEITDVAVAVNQMADNLARHIRGMRELVANISHELRSPLARMQISLALLEENLDGAGREQAGGKHLEKAASKVALLQEELAHMEKLIGTSLLSSKLDLHDNPPVTAPVCFSELCAEMCRRQTPLFQAGGQDFNCEIAPGVNVPGAETLLCTLVSNLLDNAAKYTEAGGKVALRLYAESGLARLEVENDHEPLAQEKLEQIFEPFNRGGLATGNGVGLGLHLVRQIAALHGGKTWAANTDGGFCFYVSLPLQE